MMPKEATLKEAMDFASIRRNVIANLTESITMSTTDAFDCWDRIEIDVRIHIDHPVYEIHWDPEFDSYMHWLKEERR